MSSPYLHVDTKQFPMELVDFSIKELKKNNIGSFLVRSKHLSSLKPADHDCSLDSVIPAWGIQGYKWSDIFYSVDWTEGVNRPEISTLPNIHKYLFILCGDCVPSVSYYSYYTAIYCYQRSSMDVSLFPQSRYPKLFETV